MQAGYHLIHIEDILTAQPYIDAIIQPHVVPMMQQPGDVPQHYNARSHAFPLTRDVLQRHSIQVLLWSSKADLNSIEYD